MLKQKTPLRAKTGLKSKTSLKAKTGLKRTSALKAHKHMNKKSKKKAKQDYQLEKIRQDIINRDKGCVLCGGKYEQLHHINFRSHGVDHSKENLVCLCHDCHDNKAHGVEAKKIREQLKSILSERYGYNYEKI